MNILENLKNLIATKLGTNVVELLTETADSSKGDFSIKCFSLAKEYKKSPVEIANDFAEKLKDDDFFEKCEVVGGYLNLYIKKEKYFETFKDLYAKNEIGQISQIGKNKNAFIDFSSVNLAKYMHIGHLMSTSIGNAMSNLLESAGYNMTRINYVGDYGTSFGKILSGYELWGSKEKVEKDGLEELQSLYVKFSKAESEDEKYRALACETFVKLENFDPELTKLQKWFSEISLIEVKRLTSMMGVIFDDWRGESFYMGDNLLESKNLIKNSNLAYRSEGAMVIDLTDKKLGYAMVEKSDGGSSYLSRDIAALLDRKNLYNFDKGYYITAIEQKFHFGQVFEVAKKLGIAKENQLHHLSYGMASMPSGKIGSRFGKQAVLSEIFDLSIEKAKNVLKDRNYDEKNINEIATAVGISAAMFSVLKTERIKDTIFDLEKSISFEGETSPYIQYTFARANSVIKKSKDFEKKEISYCDSEEEIALIKLISKFDKTILSAIEDMECCYLSRYLLSLCKAFNIFYTKYRIQASENIVDENRYKLTEAVIIILKKSMNILGIKTIDIM